MSDYSEHLISMAGGDGDTVADRVAAIRKSNDTWLQSSVTDRNDRNTRFLLDLIHEQSTTLAAVLNLANTSGRCGWRISADELRKVLRGES